MGYGYIHLSIHEGILFGHGNFNRGEFPREIKGLDKPSPEKSEGLEWVKLI